MDTLLNSILDMLRAAPWLVWVLSVPAVIFVRNKGLGLAYTSARISRRAPTYAPRTMLIVLCTLVICAGLLAGSTIAYQHLKLN